MQYVKPWHTVLWMKVNLQFSTSFSTISIISFQSYQDDGNAGWGKGARGGEGGGSDNERLCAMEPHLKRSAPQLGLKPRIARSVGQLLTKILGLLAYCARCARFKSHWQWNSSHPTHGSVTLDFRYCPTIIILL